VIPRATFNPSTPSGLRTKAAPPRLGYYIAPNHLVWAASKTGMTLLPLILFFQIPVDAFYKQASFGENGFCLFLIRRPDIAIIIDLALVESKMQGSRKLTWKESCSN